MGKVLIFAVTAASAANASAANCEKPMTVRSFLTVTCQDASEAYRAAWTDPANDTRDDATTPDQRLEVHATPVPEPAAAGVLMLAGGTLLLSRPGRTLKGGLAE